MSAYEQQQARKRSERWYGPWEQTREAIIAARGARECADVAAEYQPGPPVPSAEELARMRNMTDLERAVYEQYAISCYQGMGYWLNRQLYGEPIDYSEDRLP